MKLFHRLVGGRGIRCFSFWLTLWGLVSLAFSLIYPADFCSSYSVFVTLCHLSMWFNPVALAVDSQLPNSTPDWVPPLFGPLAWYALGRFLDWLFLKKQTSV